GETKDSLFKLSIKDQGIGLSPENKKKVFDKFYKVDSSNTTLEGSGLGLNIAKYIIEAHGGNIWLESKIKKGTTVSFTIPLWSSPPK
ncbi:MAG: ATP-binding protein, partial [Candidatus Aminicenantaceae bacterium]